MNRPLRLLGQVVLYALFGAFVGAFANTPVYRHFDPALALVRLSFQHAGDRVHECRKLSPEEIAKLAPNMRQPLDCPRGRVDVLLELEVDGNVRYRETLAPTGLASDGPARIYARLPVAAGSHTLTARMRDSRRTEGFDHVTTQEIDLASGQAVVIDFNKAEGAFEFLR